MPFVFVLSIYQQGLLMFWTSLTSDLIVWTKELKISYFDFNSGDVYFRTATWLLL